MASSSLRTSRVINIIIIIIHHHHIRSQNRGDYLELTFLFLVLTNNYDHTNWDKKEKHRIPATSCGFWLISSNSKNLKHFPPWVPIITPRHSNPHLARQVCATFYSPWHNSLSEVFRKISTPRNFHLLLRYSHGIISIVSQFARALWLFSLKNFSGPSRERPEGAPLLARAGELWRQKCRQSAVRLFADAQYEFGGIVPRSWSVSLLLLLVPLPFCTLFPGSPPFCQPHNGPEGQRACAREPSWDL